MKSGYIAPQSKHVTLGFFFGSQLADPHGLLLGTGARIRHMTAPTSSVFR